MIVFQYKAGSNSFFGGTTDATIVITEPRATTTAPEVSPYGSGLTQGVPAQVGVNPHRTDHAERPGSRTYCTAAPTAAAPTPEPKRRAAQQPQLQMVRTIKIWIFNTQIMLFFRKNCVRTNLFIVCVLLQSAGKTKRFLHSPFNVWAWWTCRCTSLAPVKNPTASKLRWAHPAWRSPTHTGPGCDIGNPR